MPKALICDNARCARRSDPKEMALAVNVLRGPVRELLDDRDPFDINSRVEMVDVRRYYCSYTCMYEWAHDMAAPEGLDGRTEVARVNATHVAVQTEIP